jgi:hypothetical protein
MSDGTTAPETTNIEWLGPFDFPTADGGHALYVESLTTVEFITTSSARTDGNDELDHYGGITEPDDEHLEEYENDGDCEAIYITDAQVAAARAAFDELDPDGYNDIPMDDFLEVWQDTLGLC